MNDFEWTSEIKPPDITDSGIELLVVISEFKKFPSNLINNRRGRIKSLKQYYNKVSSINYNIHHEVFLADTWLSMLHKLIYCAEHYGKHNCYQKDLRRQITSIKKRGSVIEEDIISDVWFSMSFGSSDDMIESWIKYKI